MSQCWAAGDNAGVRSADGRHPGHLDQTVHQQCCVCAREVWHEHLFNTRQSLGEEGDESLVGAVPVVAVLQTCELIAEGLQTPHRIRVGLQVTEADVCEMWESELGALEHLTESQLHDGECGNFVQGCGIDRVSAAVGEGPQSIWLQDAQVLQEVFLHLKRIVAAHLSFNHSQRFTRLELRQELLQHFRHRRMVLAVQRDCRRVERLGW